MMSVPVDCTDCGMTVYTTPYKTDVLCSKCDENKELRSLSLWAIRRLPKTYKEFAYNEYDEITGETAERD